MNKTRINCGKKTHGLTGHRLHHIWNGIKDRCYTKTNPRYPLYGGRGVVMCDYWLENFQHFYDWAMENGYEDRLELDKDKLSPTGLGMEYSPKYCCFLTHKENCNYTRRSRKLIFNGKEQSITEWCKELGLERRTTSRRIFNQGWSVEKAFTFKKISQ